MKTASSNQTTFGGLAKIVYMHYAPYMTVYLVVSLLITIPFIGFNTVLIYGSGQLYTFANNQGWVIRRRRNIRRIVFITYLTVFFKLLRIIRFWALNKLYSHKPPRAPQKHSQARESPPEEPPSPSECSMITCLLLPQPRRWCL